MNRRHLLLGAAALAAARPARAEEQLKVAIGQRGNWEQSPTELGRDQGFFAKRGLGLDILYTEGGGQTQQAVISGSVDIGCGVGTYGVMGSFAKGAPLRIIGNCTVGANDLYWYVPANSPIRTKQDLAGRTVAYSTAGSSTNLAVLGLQRALGIKMQPTATGSPASTFTQVMSGQIDVGWASPPFGIAQVERGEIRIVARGGDAPDFNDQTVRVMIVNATTLARRPDAVAKFVQAYRESMDWMYQDPAALLAYGKFANIDPEIAKKARDEFYPQANIDVDRVVGLDSVMTDAITYKYLNAPLRPEQMKTLVQLQPK